MKQMPKKSISTLLDKYEEGDKSLITLLQDIQQTYGYIPKEVLEKLGKALDIPVSKLFALVTFYNSFSLEPQGKHVISVCLGTACHVKNGERVASVLGEKLSIKDSEGTTPDGMFTIKKVRCLGCCSMAPVFKINDAIHGHVTHTSIENVLKQYRKDSK